MKTVVIVQQNDNWEDDGGDHDPLLISLSDADFITIKTWHDTGEPISDSDHDRLGLMLAAGTPCTCPCNLDGVFNIWWRY
jgi:hypothetical protein